MALTVKQLKEKIPLADVTELKDGVKYIVRVKGRQPESTMHAVQRAVLAAGINAFVCDEHLEFLEIID